jgi:hypothetical protein
MINGRRIVVCIPYGRRRTVSILMNYLRRDAAVIDEVQFWMNTDQDQAEDRAWAYEQEQTFEGWVKCVERPKIWPAMTPKQLNTGLFYSGATDPNTYYFRFDDDIVYVHPAYFQEMVAFREANPDYFLVMGNIWNNATTSYLHQQAGRIGREYGTVESPWCMDPVAWRSPKFAMYIHGVFQSALASGGVDRFLFDEPHVLADAARFSISNFMWRGEDAAAWGGMTPLRDEEIFLTEGYPKQIHRSNVVNGRALVVHYSFFDQRPALDKTDILEGYRAASERALSAVYYDLIGSAVPHAS